MTRNKKPRSSKSAGSDEAGDDLEHDDLLPILEAMLFAAHEPLAARRIARALGPVSEARVTAGLELLSQRLDERQSPAKLVELAGGFRLMTRPEYAPYLGRLFHKADRERLSPAALETLAIVAYKQPATRADIEAVRGVQAGPALKTLQEKRLVKAVGRAPVIGRPVQYGTTAKFLDLFGLGSLQDLPDVFDDPEHKPKPAALPLGQAETGLDHLNSDQDSAVHVVPEEAGEPMQDDLVPPPMDPRTDEDRFPRRGRGPNSRTQQAELSIPQRPPGIAGLLEAPDPEQEGEIASSLEGWSVNDAVRGLLEAGRSEWGDESILDLDFLGGAPAYEDPFPMGGLPYLGGEEWEGG